ncbi:hypothetical protein BU23DRAFT_590215 [Bimuria novae-zelandiae CBS 107.79]|uniref:Uncharacterized protein n=1 Tax=Bimuria novae-zelandiae CBS 107.79 TaxID=1447943 RepID=A0A6A5V702_9PLEO|nr:hypothetical protein BU23DRAFT_590215 [Bimuria novae-zelandiae CBS 107.79]
MDDEDWQSAAFNSRHMHNRVHQDKKSRRNRPFDVHKTLGSYKCKCVTWARSHAHRATGQEVTMELYRLTLNGEAIIGEICFPGMLKAAIVLAASRTSLDNTVRELVAHTETEDSAGDNNGNDEEEGEEDEEDEELEEETTRFDTFEKNSLRAPRFWLRWNVALEGFEFATADSGYLVFSGDECRKFKGTITCSEKG